MSHLIIRICYKLPGATEHNSYLEECEGKDFPWISLQLSSYRLRILQITVPNVLTFLTRFDHYTVTYNSKKTTFGCLVQHKTKLPMIECIALPIYVNSLPAVGTAIKLIGMQAHWFSIMKESIYSFFVSKGLHNMWNHEGESRFQW